MQYTRLIPLYIIAMLVTGSNVNAQVQQKVTIQQATVFLNGAELTNTARIDLPQGESEVLFTNIAGSHIYPETFAVNADGNVLVMSATYQVNYLAPKELSAKAKIIQDSIDVITEAHQQAENKAEVLQKQLDIIDANKTVSGQNTGLNLLELQHLLDFVSIKMEALLNSKAALEIHIKKMGDQLANLNLQLEEEQRKGIKPGGLLVKFHSDNATTSNIVITYVTADAGWAPIYDIRVSKLGDPLNLSYKANIYQSTGINWNNVHLILSTDNPDEGVDAPQLKPSYLTFFTLPVMAKSAQYIVDGIQVQGEAGINSHITVDNAGINTSFNIDLPYSIPTDGKNHLVSIKTNSLPATYSYYAVPKLDKDAFLQAQIINWEDLNLLPAKANIFYEGAYVGQSYIDTRNVKDTMSFSLGRDKKIIVQRDRGKDLRSVKTIGSNIRQSFAYTISVRNTRKQPINLILSDQLPVSNDNDIVIEDKEVSGGDYNETTGEVKWNLNINASETKKVKLGYTVKYPKGRIVSNLGN